MRNTILVLAALLSCATPPAFAQLASHPDAPVRVGHYHLNVTSVEAPPAASGASAVYGRFAYFLGPDGVKIELVTSDQKDAPPIVAHHIHFINKQYVEMQQWYMKAFDATLRPGQTDFFIGADLPGVGYSLNFFRWEGDQSISHVPTAGRVVDHVGFEVKNLEAFCKALEAKGIKAIRPYRKRDAAMNNIATATIVDPWGVSIELTEGLDKID